MSALALLRAAWGIAKLIPWQIYAVIVAAIAIYGYGIHEHHAGYREARAEDAKVAEAQRKAMEADAAMKNAKLFADGYEAKQKAAYLEWKLQDQQKESAVQLAAAKAKETTYVGTIALASANYDLPRGYILWRIDSAGFANGVDFPDAPAAPIESLGQPSGISVAQISDLDLAQAQAYRDTKEWGIAWRDRAQLLETTCNAIINTVKGSP